MESLRKLRRNTRQVAECFAYSWTKSSTSFRFGGGGLLSGSAPAKRFGIAGAEPPQAGVVLLATTAVLCAAENMNRYFPHRRNRTPSQQGPATQMVELTVKRNGRIRSTT
jgi:hypothetical protein